MEQQPRQLGASMDDLLRLIGQLTVENQLLRAEVDRLSRPVLSDEHVLQAEIDRVSRPLEAKRA